jgi:C4-dicarboxylate transporter DctQ subunit
MNRFLERLDKFEDYLLAFLLPAMTVTILIATFTRFTNLFIVHWAEELTRYMMIWLMFLGASAAMKKGEHFSVTALTMVLPPIIQKILNIVRMILMTGFFIFISRYTIVILKNQMMMGQISPALHWPMWTVYSAVLVGCVLMLIRFLVHDIKKLRNEKKTTD